MTSRETGAVPTELVAMAQQAAAQQLTDAALDRRFGPRSAWEPARGQIWRALREDIGVLVLVLAVDTDSITAVPVTVECITGVADALQIGSEGTCLGVPVTVWTGLRSELPTSVLDRPIDDLEPAIVRRVADQAAQRGEVPGAVGGLPPNPEASEARAALQDDLIAMIEVPAVEDDVSKREAQGRIDIGDIGPEALDEVAARLGVQLPVVLDLIDGKRAPTPHDIDVIRDVLGAEPTATPPPAGLVRQFNQPKWRGLVRQRARRDHLTESAARLVLAYEITAMAARQTGDQEPSWPDRIRQWAEVHQLDPDSTE